MTDNINKLMAEALVECGYAPLGTYTHTIYPGAILIIDEHINVPWISEVVDPFANTLEGRRQADALEDYFEQRPDLWELWNSFPRPYVYDVGETMREWRLDQIKWCFEQLAEKSHD